jgi:hypothetical protein
LCNSNDRRDREGQEHRAGRKQLPHDRVPFLVPSKAIQQCLRALSRSCRFFAQSCLRVCFCARRAFVGGTLSRGEKMICRGEQETLCLPTQRRSR